MFYLSIKQLCCRCYNTYLLLQREFHHFSCVLESFHPFCDDNGIFNHQQADMDFTKFMDKLDLDFELLKPNLRHEVLIVVLKPQTSHMK